MSYNARQEQNKLILQQIKQLVEQQPDLRFHQILQNIGVIELDKQIKTGEFGHDIEQYSTDKFYEESSKTYERVLETLSNWK